MFDRLDISIDLAPVTPADLAAPANGESSATVGSRVAAARAAQLARATELAGAATLNAALPDSALERVAKPDTEGSALLTRAAESLGFSARAYHRILRLARTLADLEGLDAVKRRHIAEAVSYRRKDLASPMSAPEPSAAKSAGSSLHGV